MTRREICVKRIVLVAIIILAAATVSSAGETIKRIMVYGDSNSFGWLTNANGTVGRFPLDVAWPGVMGKTLGQGHEVVVEALGGRTTNLYGPDFTGSGNVGGAGMNGAVYLPPALSSHMPLDLVIIMLGTNDLRSEFDRAPEDIAAGVIELVDIIRRATWQSRTNFTAPQVLVISPPKVDIQSGPIAELFRGALVKAEVLPNLLRSLIEQRSGVHFFDAATVIPFAGQPDEIHLTRENHAALGRAVAMEVQSVFAGAAIP